MAGVRGAGRCGEGATGPLVLYGNGNGYGDGGIGFGDSGGAWARAGVAAGALPCAGRVVLLFAARQASATVSRRPRRWAPPARPVARRSRVRGLGTGVTGVMFCFKTTQPELFRSVPRART
jgi:hypothetical protein